MRMMKDDSMYISLICNGRFDAAPDYKIGELFENYFKNINYNVIKDEENNICVDFLGEALSNNNLCKFIIRFEVDKIYDEFNIVGVKKDGEIMTEEEAVTLLEDIARKSGADFGEDYYEAAHGPDIYDNSPNKYGDFDSIDDEENNDKL